jgi:hypothetical protein
MNDIKPLVLGEGTESAIKHVFDHRILEESKDPSHNTISRALRVKNLKSQIIGFIERNPNGHFELVAPEYKSEKLFKLSFNNFEEEDDEANEYQIVIADNFVEAEVIHKVTVGKDIVLKLRANE